MLFTPRLLLVNGQEVTTLRKSPLLGQAIYVVARGDCSFRRVRLSGTGRDAHAAAQMRAKSEALPGEDGSSLVIDSSSHDQKQSSSSALMAGSWSFPTSLQHRGRYLPETLAQRPLADGARIVRGLSGFEGQIWRKSDLVASRWWDREPLDQDWDGFIRAAQENLGVLDMPRPPVVEVPWRDDLPIFGVDRERLSQIFSPGNVGALVATGLACSALYISGQYLREKIVLTSVDQKAAALRGETEQIQSERRRALANLSYVKRYRSLGNNGTLLAGLSGVANVLGQTDLGIERASFRDGRLELMLKGVEEISVPDVVSLLEAEPTLSSVSVSLEAAETIIVKTDLSPPLIEPPKGPPQDKLEQDPTEAPSGNAGGEP